MCVACIGVVVGLWDFGDFCLCGVFVCRVFCACECVCMTKPLPGFVAGACMQVICYLVGLAGFGAVASL